MVGLGAVRTGLMLVVALGRWPNPAALQCCGGDPGRART